ncbi:MAG: ArsR family transcriptional regulator, partial [Pseudomonadota bacterium]
MKAPKSKKPARDPAIDAFVLRWGEMGRVWGLPRSAGQIHGLLLAAAEPMSAEEISAALGLARSNVSTSLKELRSLGVIRAAAALGDRAERFAALEDPMDTARAVAAARKAR